MEDKNFSFPNIIVDEFLGFYQHEVNSIVEGQDFFFPKNSIAEFSGFINIKLLHSNGRSVPKVLSNCQVDRSLRSCYLVRL